MTKDASGKASREPATETETRVELLKRNTRAAVPIRNTFVQLPRGAPSRPGVLHRLVGNGDRRALRAFMVIVGYTSKDNVDGWTTRLDSGVWARSFGATETLDLPAARIAAERTLARLERLNLVTYSRERGSPKISVTLSREDGTGDAYERPNGRAVGDRFFSVPRAFWERELDKTLSMPELAMLLAILKERDNAEFPAERMPDWYGWSADTTLRGLKGLLDRGLVERRESWRKDPLSPVGFTTAYQYQPVLWLRPSRGAKTTTSKKKTTARKKTTKKTRKLRAAKAAATKEPRRPTKHTRTAS